MLEFTKENRNIRFVPKDIIKVLLEKYPDINKSTVRCQLIQHCVNHTSRKHYASGQEDFYFWEDGVYRIYDEENDGSWDWQGNPINL